MTFWSPKLRSLRSKGKKLFTSECWTFRGHYLKTSPLRFFSSENKKRRKIRLLLEIILKNCYILIFDPLLLKKLIFFSETLLNCWLFQWNEALNQKTFKGRSCQKLDLLCLVRVSAHLVWFGSVIWCARCQKKNQFFKRKWVKNQNVTIF